MSGWLLGGVMLGSNVGTEWAVFTLTGRKLWDMFTMMSSMDSLVVPRGSKNYPHHRAAPVGWRRKPNSKEEFVFDDVRRWGSPA